MKRWIAGAAVAGCLLLALALAGIHGIHPRSGSRPAPGFTQAIDTRAGIPVCGQPVLDSPYDYDRAPGPFSSGTRGLPTYGKPDSDFPHATAGVVLPTGLNNYLSYELKPYTVYYLLPGVHTGAIQADTGDVFVGGRSGGKSAVLTGNYSPAAWAIDSNPTIGDQSDVTIEYLTIQKYRPPADGAAINQETNTGWTVQYNTITLNVPGAGVLAGARNVLRHNCLTLNGQYGFQSTDTVGFSNDSLTTGPYDVTVEDNEISYNDTCDFSGKLSNPAIGWKNHNPVPARYQNPECGTVSGDGNQGGFKLWQTNGVTIKENYIHNNWGPGGWADTDNANTTWTDNTITDNEGVGIIEEISYNFSITGNYLARNDWIDGLNNPSFPQPAIYISESGSDTTFGGVPACAEAACAGLASYRDQSVISGNTLVDNGGSIFLWQNSNRNCADGSDQSCTLVEGGRSGPFTVAACKSHLVSAAINATTYTGTKTGSPLADWWDGCMWRTQNVRVTNNTIAFNPADIANCNNKAWPACGAGGIFSEYGGPNRSPGWVVPTQLTFFQDDTWSKNTYIGPSTFFAWNQGNAVTWAQWTGQSASGDKCTSPGERQSGYCAGPFEQDSGSTYTPARK